ncbi:hypothetical protein IAQ61_003327 [Plenodomus lingam]|nr:hypothetical protein IAQ61_003327 [Plenodomus lingam]
MEELRIADLSPTLPEFESKHFRASVILIWPYSSSQRQFSLLLADPDFRLRRRNGQVRVRFTGSSAKAIATTGAGIGDELLLSLRGAQFVKQGAIQTPGRSIDWELEYEQTVVVQVFRNGSQLANLELNDVAPTPVSRSPSHRVSLGGPSPSQQWSSPAVLKRIRLSDGLSFEAPYDPLTEDVEHGHVKKRRRKSYRDWKTWTYSARTPSPEKDDEIEEDLEDDMEHSPIHMRQLPDTPVSPAKPESPSVVTAEQQPQEVRQQGSSSPESKADDGAKQRSRNNVEYHELYAGPNDFPLEESQYAFGGDTEIDTEENTEIEDAGNEEPEFVSMSTTVANTEDEHVDDQLYRSENDFPESRDADLSNVTAGKTTNTTDIPDQIAGGQEPLDGLLTAQNAANASNPPITTEKTTATDRTMKITMLPPTFPTLQIDTAAPVISDLLTPVGREPSSPKLKPLDSSTLPLPSPFPGNIDTDMASQEDYFASNQGATIPEIVQDQKSELPSDADYIMETSFFSSIGSSKDASFHPNHESAFTPLRFTFGIDGGGCSRLLDLSSPAPEGTGVQETLQLEHDDSLRVKEEASLAADKNVPSSPGMDEARDESKHAGVDENAASEPSNVTELAHLDIIELSSDAETESETSGSEEELEVAAAEDDSENSEAESERYDDEYSVSVTQDTGAVSAIIDLGSPAADDVQDSELGTSPSHVEGHTQQNLAFESLQDIESQSQDNLLPEETENYSEFVDLDFAPEAPGPAAETQQRMPTHTPAQQALESNFDTANVQALSQSDSQSDDQRTILDGPDRGMQHTLYDLQSHTQDEGLHYPEVKMESIEEESMFGLLHSSEEGRIQTPDGLSEELVIAVPEEGGKYGEMHNIAVPATGPARNTRSKLSITASPTQERAQAPRRTTRSTQSNASVTRETISPVEKKSRGTFSSSQERSHTSPYSIQSQSRLLSPVKTASNIAPATAHHNQRKPSSQNEEDAGAEPKHSRFDDHLLDLRIFDSSYDPNASQGRFSNVTYVKDSEEDSIRSEHSISTDTQFGMHSDPIQSSGPTRHVDSLKPPPASAPEIKMRIKSRKTPIHAVARVLRSSSPAQPTGPFTGQSMASSLSRRHSSAGSEISLSEGETNMQALSPDPSEDGEEPRDQTTPRPMPNQASTSPGEGESTLDDGFPRLQQQQDTNEVISSSPPPIVNTSFLTLHHHLAMEENTLIPPDDTQQYTANSQPSFTNTQRDDDSLIAPDLTQATSFGLPSFQFKAADDPDATTVSSHKPTVDPSSDPSIDSTPAAPSIGLSTPLAYYTPLSSLPFFLNRSSQYHSSENPDILALVASASTPPARAKKGPKHYFTTLHITDLSTFPRQTSVNVFRPFESALPVTHAGDVILLRAFTVKSVRGRPSLTSAEDSAWCVWRWGKPCWGAKRGVFGEIRAREEVKGPQVERGMGEWGEVERIREWYEREIREELERIEGERKERVEKGERGDELEGEESSQRVTRSMDRMGSV